MAGGFRIFGDVSRDGAFIVYSSTERNGLDFDIYRADLESGKSTLLREGHYGQLARSLSPDGSKLIVSEVVGGDANNLYVLNLESGELDTLLVPEPRAGISRRGGFAWTADSKGFYASTNDDREFLAPVYFKLGSDGYQIVGDPEADVHNVSLCGGDRYLVWTTNVDGFFELHARDLKTGETMSPGELPEGTHSVSCGSRTSEIAVLTNGWQTPGDIHLWDIPGARIRPVFKPNVRGSSGFGRTYSTLDDLDYRLDSVRDLIDMLDYFRGDERVDAKRAAVSGQSYGGYMANAVLAMYPGNFKAGVSRYGVADWVTALEIASPLLKASDRIEYGDITQSKWRTFYEQHSPIRQAHRINVPMLYSHGVQDPRIDISETETMVRALRSNGIEVQYIRIPDEGHGWRKLSNRIFYFRHQAQFLEANL